eukprot:2617484-Ditylum_brightwellii.AAC.1
MANVDDAVEGKEQILCHSCAVADTIVFYLIHYYFSSLTFVLTMQKLITMEVNCRVEKKMKKGANHHS